MTLLMQDNGVEGTIMETGVETVEKRERRLRPRYKPQKQLAASLNSLGVQDISFRMQCMDISENALKLRYSPKITRLPFNKSSLLEVNLTGDEVGETISFLARKHRSHEGKRFIVVRIVQISVHDREILHQYLYSRLHK